MIKTKWNEIQKGANVRQELSKLRSEIKDPVCKLELCEIIKGKEEVLLNCLESEDAKTRKNAALLMGDLKKQCFLIPLWNAYIIEPKKFVKSSYLKAIGKLEYQSYLEEIKARMEELQSIEVVEEDEKHINEELRELTALVIRCEGVNTHKFRGWENPHEIVLITNRNCGKEVGEELLALEPNAAIQIFGAGVKASVENLNWLKRIRTYQEVLFLIPGMNTCEMDPLQVAREIIGSELLLFLENQHEGETPFYFRIEMKSKKPVDEKSVFIKRLVSEIEKSSNRALINSTTDYEIEIRLIENKQKECNIMVKLFTLKDRRFTYRKGYMPTSIRPVNAALSVALTREYMKEQAQVLDPFCGVGTMLIERHKAVQANTMYGIDIQEEAIVKARENTQIAEQIVHYINRDFFGFTHNYLFDEVITDMPFQIGKITEEEIIYIYQKFFEKLPIHLNKDATIILYSHDKELIKQMTTRTDFKILKEIEMSRKEGTHVVVLKYGGKNEVTDYDNE